jgi:hypothetical protein
MVIGLALFAALLLTSAELWTRVQRLTDYIRYQPDNDVGYLPQPLASGKFRNRNRWRINPIGLRSDCDDPPLPEDIVILGDSIVEGGSTTDQDQTLGYQLATLTSRRVHPACAGGWSLPNALAFMRKHWELNNAGTIVMVVNSGDLCPLNPWSSQSTHPTRRPTVHLAYLIRRYSWPWRWRAQQWLRRWRGSGTNAEKSPDSDWAAPVAAFLRDTGARVICVLYPDRTETEQQSLPCAALRPVIGERAQLVEILDAAGWGRDCYADALHPNAGGRRLLAQTIARAILQPESHKAAGG